MRFLSLLLLIFDTGCAAYATSFKTPATVKPPLPEWHCEDPPDGFEELQKEEAKKGNIIYWIRTPCTTKAD